MTKYRTREFVPTVREGSTLPGLAPEFPAQSIHSSAELAAAFGPLADFAREAFCLLMLDAKNRVIGLGVVSIGTSTTSPVDPKEVFRFALTTPNCCGLIGVHNHPSGVAEPSDNDRHITRRLADAGRILNLRLLDHIILGSGGDYYSFADRGEMS